MPFDGNTGRDLSVPSLENLRFVLLHPDEWPADFRWDYRCGDSCAIGLSRRLWSKDIVPHDVAYNAGDHRHWFTRWLLGPRKMANTKPRHVARAINRHLAA